MAKTANFLVDGLGLAPGERVGLLLPLHWQTACVTLAGWAAGMRVGFDADADVLFAAEDRLAEALDAREVVGLSLRPMAGRMSTVPVGVLDYAEEVPGYGDRFAEVPTADEVEVPDLGLSSADRVLTTLSYDQPGGLAAGLVGPLAAHAAVVLCRHPADEATLERRAEVERVTATVGVDVGGLRRLA